MEIRSLAVLTVSAIVMVGCGRDRSAEPEAARDTAAIPGPVAVLLDVPPRVRAGDEVPIAATLVNRGDATESVPAGGPDIVVTRADGAEVWRRSRHVPPPDTPSEPLKPREMRGTGYAWNQRDDAGRPVAPGTYRVRATIPSGPGEASSATAALAISPR